MKAHRGTSVILIVAVVASSAATVLRTLSALFARSADPAGAVVASPLSGRLQRDSVNELLAGALRHSPFRLGSTTAVPTVDAAPPLPQASAAPDIVVKAIVGGPPWQAVVQGLPGTTEERVVRVGERVSDVTILTIASESVVLRWNDSTWTVRLPGRAP